MKQKGVDNKLSLVHSPSSYDGHIRAAIIWHCGCGGDICSVILSSRDSNAIVQKLDYLVRYHCHILLGCWDKIASGHDSIRN